MNDDKPVKGRGAAEQVKNRFLQHSYGVVHWEGIDEVEELPDGGGGTKYIEVFPRTILNEVPSPDVGMGWSVNPYQGCEHGCSYCYARPTHEYWGYSAGLDFERTILVKRNAVELFRKALKHPKWKADTISFSGNTDCYQPVERKECITRGLLEVAQEFRQPIGIITKNALVLRDIDILGEMAKDRLATVAISLTSLNEDLRRVLEPRTSTGRNRLHAIEQLSKAGVPVFVMVAPIIPALNEHEVPTLLKAAAEAGALGAGYTVVRTNGAVQEVFRTWLRHHFPDRASKIIAQISDAHGGRMNDSEFGRRMKGQGAFAENIGRMFRVMRQRYFGDRVLPEMDHTLFKVPREGQLGLFD
ncbi:MAG TPA: PA0069 family radical SAM protein [Flavobacteriales bacterium]